MRWSRLLAAIMVPLAVVLTACLPYDGAGPAPSGNSPIYSRAVDPWGPDVSGWQHPAGGAINWAKVRAAGASFAFVKVSEGMTYTSPYFRNDLNAARAQGLYVGGYHFARPALPLSTAAEQANHFIDLLGTTRLQGWLPPVLDIEMTGGLAAANLTAWVRQFLQTVQQRTGRKPIVYTGSWFWRGYMANPTGFAAYPLWAAQYNNSITAPTLFGDWKASTFWQYTDSKSVSGISGSVDSSFFRGARTQLAAMANDSSTTTTVIDYRQTVFTGCADIRRGSTGTCVRDWQHFLNLWFGARAAKLGEDGNFGPATEGRQRSWEAETRARPWFYTDVVANLVVQRPEYIRARNHLLFFGIRW